jgi:hypothetical protein
MRYMRKIHLIVMCCAALVLITSVTFATKTKRDELLDKCDSRYIACESKCDGIIDINNQVEKCRAECTRKHNICTRNVKEAYPARTGGTGAPGQNKGPVLSPK